MSRRGLSALQPRGRTAVCYLIALTCLIGGALIGAGPPSPARAADSTYIPDTGHNVPDYFYNYWAANGGQAQFGLPLTEPYSENGLTIQWFERARFERHPEFAGTPAEIELGQLGREVHPADPPTIPTGNTSAAFFAQTGHNVATFRAYWQQHGGLAVFGLPLTEEVREVNQADGKTYTVQYFERARLEEHPDQAGTPYEVQLGLLGAERYHKVAASDPAAAAAGARVPAGLRAAAPPEAIELLMWQAVNAARAAGGVPRLAFDPLVAQAARQHVQDMIANDYLEHYGTDGSSPLDRMRAAGVNVQWGSENISMECSKDPATVVRNIMAWMMEEPLADGDYNHHWNIMHDGYSRIGIAFGVAHNGCWVMAEDFADGTPSPGSQP
ncbi:MAG TPA: CAP domain-containing protein [Thermomicrobiales bacterium]|nr:CAP domain-containing protein [Thermomicrobiales bacterium]